MDHYEIRERNLSGKRGTMRTENKRKTMNKKRGKQCPFCTLVNCYDKIWDSA